MFSRLCRTPTCVRQTDDGQIHDDRISKYRACIASHGKNRLAPKIRSIVVIRQDNPVLYWFISLILCLRCTLEINRLSLSPYRRRRKAIIIILFMAILKLTTLANGHLKPRSHHTNWTELNWGPCIYRYCDFYSKWKTECRMNIHFHFRIQTGVLCNQL